MDSTLRNFSTTANLKTQRLTGNWATLEEILFAEPGKSFSESETISAKSTASKVTRNNQDLEYEGGWVDKKDDLAFSLPSNQTRRAFQENYYSSLVYNDNQKSQSQFYTHSESNRDKKVQYYAERQVSQFETEDSFAAMLADNMIEESENRLRDQRNRPAKQICNFSLQTEDAFDLELEFLSPKSKRAKNISEEQQSVMLSTGISGCESTPSRVVRHDQKFDNSLSDATLHPSDLEFEPLGLTDRIPLRITFGAESKPRTLEQELADFNPVIDPSGIDNETLEYLCQRDRDYTPDPYYLKNKQPNLAWNMRAILVDWMIEVSVEFTLKRETFHAAVNYVDRFLSLYPNVQRQELQLIGVVSLFTSAKNEEIFSFQAEDFAKACDGAYTTAEIAKAESVLLTTLRWMLVPPTLNVFSQWYLSQWDLYIEKSPYALNCPLTALLQRNLMIQFRQPNESAYMLYREFMQYIDCVILDIDHLQYDKRTIIASVLYLLLGKEYQQFTMKQITEEFRSSSVSLFNKANAYNDLFADFLAYIFGFQMEEILPSVQYVARFFLLPLSFDLPRAVQIKGDNALDGHFEDFLSYQTHNTQALDFLRKKKKAKGLP